MVPIILVTGFLGSGKTTFLNKVLSDNPDVPISVIVNEFGSLPLESSLIKKGSGDVIELANGCMCCVAKSDVPRIVRLILDKSPQTKYILIEASGISDPDPVIETLHDSTLTQIVTLDSIVCIIDTDTFLSNREKHPIIVSQLGDADIVVLNKTSIADPISVTSIRTFISNLDPQIVILEEVPSLSTADILGVSFTHSESKEHSHASHTSYKHVLIQNTKQIDLNKVQTLLRSYGGQILRVKAVCMDQYNENQKIVFQKVGPRSTLVRENWAEEEEKQNIFLCVGSNFDEKKLESELLLCFT